MRYLHYRRAKWGYIDSAKFPQQLKDYNKTDLEHYFIRYGEKFLNGINHIVISVVTRDYFAGIYSSPFLLVASVFLFWSAGKAKFK
jgi:hypothetical protein